MGASARPAKSAFEKTEFAASAVVTGTGNGSGLRLPLADSYAFVLDVTVDESTVADKLDVFIQTKIDGTNWLDVVHFTQHDGNAGAARYVAKIATAIATAEFLNSAALAEAGVRHIAGDEWRARWVVVDDSAIASFTFSVTGVPM